MCSSGRLPSAGDLDKLIPLKSLRPPKPKLLILMRRVSNMRCHAARKRFPPDFCGIRFCIRFSNRNHFFPRVYQVIRTFIISFLHYSQKLTKINYEARGEARSLREIFSVSFKVLKNRSIKFKYMLIVFCTVIIIINTKKTLDNNFLTFGS